jgi:hypothetical protein
VKLESLAGMNGFIQRKLEWIKEPVKAIRVTLTALRDWAFENPRIAVLIMGRFKANKEQLAAYYQSNYMGKALLDAAVKAGKSKSKDTLLDSSLVIAALWGSVSAMRSAVPDPPCGVFRHFVAELGE